MKTKQFRISEKQKINLSDWGTNVDLYYESKVQYEKKLKKSISELSSLQELLYAENKYSLLIIFQAMDSAGKDSAIKHVMSGVNPQGCQVYSFKHPSQQELNHDFLWRAVNCLPERGRIGIFNRSYYEEVLIARVHPEILQAENLPKSQNSSSSIWKNRYSSINDFEMHLEHSGTKVIKFFLHISKDEQRKRFLERIDNPNKNWKFSLADINERKYWDRYMNVYQKCISETSSEHAPWYIIPADNKKNARLIISKVIVDTLNELKMDFPKTSKARKEELQSFRRLLEV